MTSRLVRLVNFIDKYGEAIEYDLHATFGLDLLDFFRHKLSWRKLEVLLTGLPSGSAFWAARADDDEVAAAFLDAKEAGLIKSSNRPELRDMSFTNQILMDLHDMLSLTVYHLGALGGTKPNAPRARPRPETGIERVKAAAEAKYTTDLIAEAHAAQARAAGVE